MLEHNRTIIELDQKTINKIAAGEVVERPSSVVKELIENSIDARATEIIVNIEGYGLDLIKVVDNGFGMSSEDLQIAWKSHTTSKIKSIEDLEKIQTMGFRGEALASIAAVSTLEICSKRKKDLVGHFTRIKGGNFELFGEKTCSDGTIVEVKNLFYNVPTRKKFLKTPTTELSHIIEVVSLQALINYNIHFTLIHNKSVLLNSPKSSNPLDPFISIYGSDDAKEMIPLSFTKDAITIHGFISSPVLSRATREYEFFYINKRAIKSQLLSEAVEEAYKTLLMKSRYPILLLNLEIDSSKVDVNIHPAKREVKFQDSHLVHQIFIEAIKITLQSSDLWRKGKGFLKANTNSTDSTLILTESNNAAVPKNICLRTSESKILPNKQLIFVSNEEQIDTTRDKENSLQKQIFATSDVVLFSDTFWIRPLGQALNLYILCETNQGIAIVDIHAAHERIKYEQLIAQYKQSKIDVQELLQPITIRLSPKSINSMQDILPQLKEVGISLEFFGGNTYIIRKLPTIMSLIRTEEEVRDFLEEVNKEIPTITPITERIDSLLKIMACHSVIRSGEAITMQKTASILKQLTHCTLPFSCPHGRPTIIKTSKKELEKEFGRII